MWKIFDQPWTLLGIGIIALLVMLILRKIFPEKLLWWHWLIPPIIAAAGFGLDLLVKTDLEKIETVILTAVKAVEEENAPAIAPLISDDYADPFHTTKAALMHHARRRLSEPLVDRNVGRIIETDISSPSATVVCTVRTVFDKNSPIYGFKHGMLTKLKITLKKESDNNWTINRADILTIDRQPADWSVVR